MSVKNAQHQETNIDWKEKIKNIENCDSCYSCKDLRMSERMLFCKGEGKYELKGIGYQKNNHIFNVQVSEKEFSEAMSSRPTFKLPLTKWIEKKDMTEDEKKDYTICEQIGGYLKVLSFEDAWKEGWSNASKEFKDWVKGLPNFNAELFKDITGIDINECEVVKDGQIIEVCINGKHFKAKVIKD